MLSEEDRTRLRLLADGTLYDDAMEFAREQKRVANDGQFGHQIQGLKEYAADWDRLTRFVNHQNDRIDREQLGAYRSFYRALREKLNGIGETAENEFVPKGLTKNETRELTSAYASRMGSAFIRHLAAEMLWQKEVVKNG